MNYVSLLLSLCFLQACNSIWYYHGSKVLDRGVPPSDELLILKKHNELRRLIANGEVDGQPPGKNLKLLKWDKRLAEQAQIIANKENFTHVRVSDSRWLVGQNLHRKKSNRMRMDTLWDSAIQHWFNEHDNYKFGNKSIKGTGHYTQTIWAKTEYVGCGYCYYETAEPMKYHKLYVCNYGPRGNIVGVLPYTVGNKTCEDLC